MINPKRREQITVLGGGLILVLFVILSWIPSGCPVVRHALIGCPTVPLSLQTPDEQETNRVPHQTITDNSAVVDVKTQDQRGNTRITFEYRAPTGTTATLGIEDNSTLVPLATIAHPLIPTDSSWHLFSSHGPDTTLYTREPITQTTVLDYLNTHPSTLVADVAAARLYNLKTTQYTSLDSITSLDGHNSLLLSYAPAEQDMTWKWFQQVVDLSQYQPDANNHFQFVISVTRPEGSSPLLLGEVHVDYRK